MSQNLNQPLVSIVMPTYNQERFIGKAIQSVLDQTYQNWELIVVNNFSTDQTKSIVEGFSEPRVKMIDFANQGVIAASRNLAIKSASGAFIAFLDSDDYWTPTKLALCLAKIDQGFDLVCHGEYFFSDGSEAFKPTEYGPESDCGFAKMLAHGNCLSTSAIVVKKSVLDAVGVFDENRIYNTAEDFDLWLRVSRSGYKVGILSDMLGYYRIHAGSASASNLKNAKATLAVLEKYKHEKKLSWLDQLKSLLFRTRVRVFIWRSEP